MTRHSHNTSRGNASSVIQQRCRLIGPFKSAQTKKNVEKLFEFKRNFALLVVDRETHRRNNNRDETCSAWWIEKWVLIEERQLLSDVQGIRDKCDYNLIQLQKAHQSWMHLPYLNSLFDIRMAIKGLVPIWLLATTRNNHLPWFLWWHHVGKWIGRDDDDVEVDQAFCLPEIQ